MTEMNTEMNEADMRLRAVVPAPVKVTHEAVTDPAALRAWLSEHAEVDLPGTYAFWGRSVPDGVGCARVGARPRRLRQQPA